MLTLHLLTLLRDNIVNAIWELVPTGNALGDLRHRYTVYYRKEPTFHLTKNFRRSNYVALIDFTLPASATLDHIYHVMQGHVWSPEGEARDLIIAKRLHHTSMSVGDLIHNMDTDKWYEVAPSGFKEIER